MEKSITEGATFTGSEMAGEEKKLLEVAEKEIGVPIYILPEEHELSNVRGYTAGDEAESLINKITLAGHIPLECWRKVALAELEVEGFAAVVYGRRTHVPITVFVGETVPQRHHALILDTYIAPLTAINNLNLGVCISSHSVSELSNEEFRRELPGIEERAAEKKAKYGDVLGTKGFVERE